MIKQDMENILEVAFAGYKDPKTTMDKLVERIKFHKVQKNFPAIKQIVKTQTKLVREATDDEKIKAINECSALLLDEFYDPALQHSEALFFPSQENELELIKYLKMADNYCYVCVYTITNDKLARVLYTLKQAGVDVRVISDDETATNDGSDLAKLANAGIPVRIDTDPQARMHHKFIVIDDDLLLNGSFNWTSTAVNSNYENVVVMDHGGLIGDFKKVHKKSA